MLLDDLRAAGFDELIPRHTEPDYCEYTHEIHSHIKYDNYDDEDYRWDDEDEDEGEPNYYDEGTESWYSDKGEAEDYTYETIEELRCAFDLYQMSDEEFLEMSIADLFGITKPQLKFIDTSLLYRCSLAEFRDGMIDEEMIKKIPDVEKRINYLEAKMVSRADNVQFAVGLDPEAGVITRESEKAMAPERQKLPEYLDKIMLSRKPREAIELIGLLKDYYNNWGKAKFIDDHRDDPKFKYPLFPKIGHIKDYHDKATRDVIMFDSKMSNTQLKQIDYDIKDRNQTKEYRQYLYTEAEYCVCPIRNYDEILREGKELAHCVATYAGAFAAGRSLIYGIRKTSNPDTPFYTAEVIKYGNGVKMQMQLNQCYGYNDTIQKTPECRAFIKRWAQMKGLTITCEI